MRIAVATSSFKQPLRRSIEIAAESGATGIQFDARYEVLPADFGETARRQLLHALDERGLKVASLSFPLRKSLHDQEQLERRLDALRTAMQFASQLKCRVVTTAAPRVPETESVEWQMLHDVLEDLARYANHVGVTLALTLASAPPESLIEVLQTIRQGPVGIDFDPATVVLGRREPADDLRAFAAWLTHMQVRDAIRDQEGDGKEVPVGRGEVDWPELLAVLQEIDYQGWLTVRRTTGDDPAGDTMRAVQFVQRVGMGG